MKKNYLFGALAMATMMFTASCSEQELVDPSMGNTEVVTFTVNTKQLGTRAGESEYVHQTGDALYATSLYYGVYENVKDVWKLVPGISVTTTTENVTPVEIKDGSANVKIRLVKQKDYKVVFWAENSENRMCEINWDTQTLTSSPSGSNKEAYDAFWGYNDVNINGAEQKSVTLTRPFAQLNIGVSNEDWEAAAEAGVEVLSSAVTVYGVPTEMNLLDASVKTFDMETSVTYQMKELPKDYKGNEFSFPVGDHHYLALNYVLVANGSDQSPIKKVELSFEDKDGLIYNNTYSDVPVRRNYRTNIYGNLLTNSADYKVDVNPDFGEVDNLYYVWDGEEIKEPQQSKEDQNIYEITYASELAWLAAAVNGTLPETTRATVAADNFVGKTFRLTRDIDLGGKEWTPIGSSDKNIFKGTFDGQGFTVKNLFISGNNSNVGLFGVTHEGEIKNLTVKNANVSGRLNVGIVAGQPYTSKYTNITVNGHVEVNGMAYVGGVGGKNAYADWTNIKVEADETSYVKANSVENGKAYRTYVGGVVGFNGEGAHKFSNITSNINVMGSTCDVGGLFGIAHYGNMFETCVCTGDVEIYAAEEADEAEEIGGIAGVWHNGGEDVVLTNCSFEGKLKTNIDGIKFYYGGLVGKPYSNDGNGKLLIGGKHYVASSSELQSVLNAATTETTIYLGRDIEGNVTAVQKPDVKITVDGEGKKFNGSIKVHSNSNHYTDAALTVKNVNFESSVASTNIIEALENGSERYSTNITVENCTFTATGEAVNTAVGVQIKASKNAKVIRCTAIDMHSLIQAQSCDETVLVQNCTVNGKNGVAFKQVKTATVEGTTITALEYGIRFDGNTDNYGITVKNNNVTAVQPFIVRKMTGKNNTITLVGTNTLTTESEYQIVITNGSDDEEYVKPTGTYTLTGAEGYGMFPKPYPVATWDEFTAALVAGEDWIKLTADISTSASYTLTKDLKLELNGKAFAIDDATACLNIGDKNNTTKPNVTIKGGNLNCRVYGLSGNVTIKDVVFGGTVSYISAYQGVVNTKHANLLMENCKMTNVKKSGSTKPRSICTEGRSSGYLILRDCNFKNSNLDRPYINPLNGNTTLELTNCALYGAASNIDLGASYSWTNMNLTGCSGGFTFTISRTSTSLTEEEFAVYKAIKKNNSGSMRFIFSDGEKNNL